MCQHVRHDACVDALATSHCRIEGADYMTVQLERAWSYTMHGRSLLAQRLASQGISPEWSQLRRSDITASMQVGEA
jgi:hypothetical protein